MELRQIIIIVVTLAAAIYGGIDYLKRSGAPADVVKMEQDFQAFKQTIESSLKPAGIDQTLLAKVPVKIGDPWDSTGFFVGDYDKSKVAKKEIVIEKVVLDPGEFIYSGYIDMNNDKIAIINGIDYKTGETINDFRILEISAGQILLEKEKQIFTIKIKESQ